ncbi:M56 family metallopeptidase [Gimesia panareensis]|uniref:M56 family metallopeptidase n=1 Tax=Gimesia panareensis TaxID=2527978 RepID=UPI00118A7E22|nr:M56 family metallopeptidase [Gimesia panareensis]QDU52924.1 Regulatory protein BlaR1 [Gimesia panareensis]
MNGIFFLHPDFSFWLCLTLVHSLWIWTAIALLIFVLDRLMKTSPVEQRYGLHLGALVTGLVLLPVTFYFVQLHAAPTPSSVIASPVTNTVPEHSLVPATAPGSRTFTPVPAPVVSRNQPPRPATTLPASQTSTLHFWQRSLPWLAGGYLLGVGFMLIRLLRSMLSVNLLSTRATLLHEGPLEQTLNTIATEWSLRLKPRIAQTEELIVPTVVGLFRPLILLPASMLSGLTTAELELILTHELAHVRRWDMWFNLLQRLAETILFFNLGLWYVSRKISVLREFCCDEMTCNHQPCDQHAQRINYASALLRVLELAQPNHPQAADLTSLAASGASPSEVRRRVARLFGEPLPEPFRLSRGLIWSILIFLLFCGSTIWAMHTGPGKDNFPSSQTSSTKSTTAFQTQPIEKKTPDDLPLNPLKKEPATSRNSSAKKSTDRINVSGKILLEDGTPADAQGHLYYDSPGIQGTVGSFTDTFQGRFPAGPLVLTYFSPNHAPVRLDVGTLKAGVPRNDLKLILKPGHSHQLTILNEQGEPVPEVTVVIHPTWGESGSGPIFPLKANEQGTLTLQHLADTSYDVKVSAPGYEPRQSKQLPVKADGTSTITLKASQRTTGRILDEAGKPVAGVTLYLKHQFGGQSSNAFTGSGRGTFWGKPLTKTDQDGRYELTELTSGADYLFVIEAPDGRRAVLRDIQAGQDQDFVLPDRRDLRITFSKDFIQKYSIKNDSKVAVRQRVVCEPAEKTRYVELIGADIPIKVTASGGTAFFPGIAIDPQPQTQEVTVTLQYHKGPHKTVPIADTGETHVEFELAQLNSDKELSKTASAPQRAVEKISVVVAKHMMLLNGRLPITWEELDRHFASLKNPAEVRPAFFITRGALGAERAAVRLNQQIGKLQQKYHFRGSSQGTLSARTDYYYDHLKTEADLKPDPADKLTGRVVDLKGKPIADAEVVLITPVPESISYKTYELALVQGHIRNPVEHMMVRSNSQGEFTLYPPAGEKYYIMALHPEQGFKFNTNDYFASQNEIKLLPWSGLKVNVAEVPGETQTVSLRTQVDARDGWPEISINQYWSDLPVEAQKQRFLYQQIPPINQTLISRMFQNKDGGGIGLAGVSVSLLPEEVREISLGPLSPQQAKQLEWMRNRSRRKN